MNGLEPDRYYRVLVKSIIGANVYIFDQPDFYFKVIQNVNATVDNIFTNGSSFTTAFDLSFSS